MVSRSLGPWSFVWLHQCIARCHGNQLIPKLLFTLWSTLFKVRSSNLVDRCASMRCIVEKLWVDLEARSRSQQGHMWKSKLVICWLTIGPRVKQLVSKCRAFYVELTGTYRFYPKSHWNTFFAAWNDQASEKTSKFMQNASPHTRSDSLHSLNISASKKTLRVKVVGNWPQNPKMTIVWG